MTHSNTADIETPSQYLTRAAQAAREVFARYPQHALDEQAGPAYLQGLALSRWIFWQRLTKVLRLLPPQGSRCLDFGCGFGMLLPLLQQRFDTVYGVDVMPDLAPQFLQVWDEYYHERVDRVELKADIQHHALSDGSLDLILALDVLEHVDALDDLLETIARLLKSDGVLLVTGPTENWVYQLGRRIVGFSGDYHVHSIHDIRQEMEPYFDVELVDRVFYPFTLFHVLKATPRQPTHDGCLG